MAQLIVRNLDDEVKEKLKARAAQNGRSLEGEVRDILEMAMAELPASPPDPKKKGFGTLMREHFAKVGMTKEEHAQFEAAIQDSRRKGRSRDPFRK